MISLHQGPRPLGDELKQFLLAAPFECRLRHLQRGPDPVVLALALGDVPGDLAKPEQFARGVADRGDYDAGPEAGAVLADAPALLLVASSLRGRGELALGLAGIHVGFGVED